MYYKLESGVLVELTAEEITAYTYPYKMVDGKMVTLTTAEITEYDNKETTYLANKAQEIIDYQIAEIKKEAQRRIFDVYPDYKQRNSAIEVSNIQIKEIDALENNTTYTHTNDELTILSDAETMCTTICDIRNKSNTIETNFLALTEAEQETFDPTDESHWI